MVRKQYQKTGRMPDSPETLKKLAVLLYIVALIAEHCNLDQIALTDHPIQQEIRSLTDVSRILTSKASR